MSGKLGPKGRLEYRCPVCRMKLLSLAELIDHLGREIEQQREQRGFPSQ